MAETQVMTLREALNQIGVHPNRRAGKKAHPKEYRMLTRSEVMGLQNGRETTN
jgi:hypothetical protein